jgi:hypothetical protein
MADFFNEKNWTDPGTLALLAAGAGFLDPKGGMAAGMQGMMQGMQAGHQIQQRRLLSEQQAKKLERQGEIQQFLKDAPKQVGSSDPVAIGQHLMGSGYQELIPMGINLMKAKTAKSFLKGLDDKGQPTYYTGYSTGEVSPTGVTPAEKLMQINQGSQIGLANPYTGDIQKAVGVGMTPGEGARLNQAAQQFGQTHALDMAKAQQAIAQSKQPQFKDGYWVTPPNANNPQGSVIPTDLATVPKGSEAERAKSAAKVQNILGSDTEQLIGQATGSLAGAGRDWLASTVGVTTDPAKANAALKLRAASLAGNMPRFEGPQSDADRQYYQEMAGDLANPAKTTVEKLTALQELRRIHGLADSSGTIKQPVVPGGKVGGSAGTSGSWGGGNDGWGELK